MKILQIGPVPPQIGGQSHGGVATHVWELAKHLNQHGHQVGVLADNITNENRGEYYIEGVRIFNLRSRSPVGVLLYFVIRPENWKLFLVLKKHFGKLIGMKGILRNITVYQNIIDRFQPDLVHVHHLETRFPFAFYASKDRLPIITTIHSISSLIHGEQARRTLMKSLIEKNLGLAKNIIFVSQYVANAFVNHFPGKVEKCKSWIIYDPVDSELFTPYPRVDARNKINRTIHDRIILTVASLKPGKNIDLLIQAAKILQDIDPNFHVLIVGEGPQKKDLDRLINELDLKSKVCFEGPKMQAELPIYYSASDLFVLPSELEGLGIVFIEALLCGCTIIGCAESLKELIKDKPVGFYVAQANPQNIADAIQCSFKQDWDRNQNRKVALDYDWSHGIGAFLRVYQEAI